MVGGPLCIFREVLRSDAENEEYESAVLKWIYRYNGYERLGSALDATVGPLVTNWRKAGEFPTDVGIDAGAAVAGLRMGRLTRPTVTPPLVRSMTG